MTPKSKLSALLDDSDEGVMEVRTLVEKILFCDWKAYVDLYCHGIGTAHIYRGY